MFWILFLLSVLLIFYILVLRAWWYFSDRNVKFERGLPVFGSLSSAILGRTNFAAELSRIYSAFPNERYVGMYEMGGKPSVMIRDPNLAKAISIKDFDSFINHNFQVDQGVDPLMGRVLFSTTDQKWRDMRSILSPLFTGSKMRMMLSLMADSVDESTTFIRRQINEQKPGIGALEYNMMDLFSAIASDLIATCAFGIEINTLKEKDNEFFATGKSLLKAAQTGRMLIATTFPKLAKFLHIEIIEQKHDNFFREIVRSNIQQRKKQNIVRNDLIHLMFLAQQGQLDWKERDDLADAGFATVSEAISARSAEKLRDLTEDDFVAQSLGFFLAGYTTIAGIMCFLCHELAVQPDIQDRLRREVAETEDASDGKKVTYEALQGMKYLDQVVSELLRKWPISLMIDRRVSKQYVLENTDGSKMLLQPNDLLWLPVFAIHRDPQYYPNPDKFDPERFSAENRKSINPAAYFPFGLGPRACIASRFALMEIKAIIYYLLLNFRVECSEKTDVSLKLKPGAVGLDADKGFWLQLKMTDGK